MPEYRLAELAQQLDLPFRGDGDTQVSGICAVLPGVAGKLAYLSDAKLLPRLAESQAAVIIVNEALAAQVPQALIAPHPQLAFARAAALFEPNDGPDAGQHPTASVHPTAQLGPDVHLGEFVVLHAGVQIGAGSRIGAHTVVEQQARIGEQARISPSVTVGARVTIGARSLILPGAVIGSRGFGNVHDGQRWHTQPQLGSVQIGDDVEIGANSCIDRGAMDDTIIADNVRIDNQCQVAHNVHIGAHTALAAGVGIAGSTRIGKHCMLGGQAGVAGHIHIADGVVIYGGTKVLQSIDQAGHYASGLPALPVMAWRRLSALLKSLERRLKSLERK